MSGSIPQTVVCVSALRGRGLPSPSGAVTCGISYQRCPRPRALQGGTLTFGLNYTRSGFCGRSGSEAPDGKGENVLIDLKLLFVTDRNMRGKESESPSVHVLGEWVKPQHLQALI